MNCQQQVAYPDYVIQECGKPTTTTRQQYRWGDKDKAEPAVVQFEVPMCDQCAQTYDDLQNEGAIEAQAS